MDFKKLKGKFIGPQEIKKAVLHDSKTFFGKDRIVISFKKDLEPEIFPLAVLQHIVTPKPVEDLAELRLTRIKPVVADLLAILTESELSLDDLKFAINTKLSQSLQHNVDRANTILWNKDYYSGSLPAGKLTLYDIEMVLRSTEPKKNGRKRSKKKT